MREKNNETIKNLKEKGYINPQEFKNGFRAVTKEENGKKGFLNNKDKEASDFIYDRISDINIDNYSCGKKDSMWGYFKVAKNKVKELFPFRDYDYVRSMDPNGFGIVTKRINKRYLSGVVDTQGIYTVPLTFILRYGFIGIGIKSFYFVTASGVRPTVIDENGKLRPLN